MEIYVVQPGDTIYSIADKYGVLVNQIMRDNGLMYPLDLVTGQAILITFPKLVYRVQGGDTLMGIAESFGVPVTQLLRNNSFLSERNYIYPGETLVISYNTTGSRLVNGYIYPYVRGDTLRRSLPYLTYLSVFNYRILERGNIIAYVKDEDIVGTAIRYGVIPLLMLSFISLQGEFEVETANEIIMNVSLHDPFINSLLDLLRTTEYKGINILISNLNYENQELYFVWLEKIAGRMREEGYGFYLTIDPYMNMETDTTLYGMIDFERIGQMVEGITFLHFLWGYNKRPPAPVCSVDMLEPLLDNVTKEIPPEKINLGMPLIGYQWELPYIPGQTTANALTLNSAITLAYDVGAVIQFDDASQTPYYIYRDVQSGAEFNHIVWFVDIRTVDAFDRLINQYSLSGYGFWNVNVFHQQIWYYIVSQYNILKLLPES